MHKHSNYFTLNSLLHVIVLPFSSGISNLHLYSPFGSVLLAFVLSKGNLDLRKISSYGGSSTSPAHAHENTMVVPGEISNAAGPIIRYVSHGVPMSFPSAEYT